MSSFFDPPAVNPLYANGPSGASLLIIRGPVR